MKLCMCTEGLEDKLCSTHGGNTKEHLKGAFILYRSKLQPCN